jgi:hypothetical protein
LHVNGFRKILPDLIIVIIYMNLDMTW